MSLKAKIEAALFLTDKPLRAQAIAKIVNDDVQVVRRVLLELIHDYEEHGSALEIAQDNGYIIQVKDDYAQIVDEFLPMEMSSALVRTLSAIAIKQPVAQSDIIKIRGAGAYEHIRELLNRELITKREDGRSPLLATSKKFQEYFRLTKDAKILRHSLKRQEDSGQLQIASSELVRSGPDLQIGEDALQDDNADLNEQEALKQLLNGVFKVNEARTVEIEESFTAPRIGELGGIQSAEEQFTNRPMGNEVS